jgi:rhamnosyl/mannosyltransferase
MELHLHVLLNRLKRDLDVDLVVSNEDRRHAEEEVDGLRVTRLPNYTVDRSIPVSPGLMGVLRRARSDIIHLHSPNPVAELLYLLARPRGKLVVSYHHDPVRLQSMTPFYRKVFSQVAARATALVATSPNYAATSPLLRDFMDKVAVVPYGIDVRQFESSPQTERAAAALRERFGPRLILFLGRLIYYKGLDVLLQAMQHVDGKALLIGKGNLEDELRQQARALGVADKVCFLGEVENEETTPYYYASDVFVLPSVVRSEAFGIVQLEAQACARPVVSTALDSGVPYVNQDGVTGLVVPPGDPHALAGALNRLLDDAELRRRVGEAGRARVVREFTQDTMADRVRALYRQALAA